MRRDGQIALSEQHVLQNAGQHPAGRRGVQRDNDTPVQSQSGRLKRRRQ